MNLTIDEIEWISIQKLKKGLISQQIIAYLLDF